MTDKVEITVRVEVKNRHDHNTELAETADAVKSCLNGNRASSFFKQIDVIDTELKEDSW